VTTEGEKAIEEKALLLVTSDESGLDAVAEAMQKDGYRVEQAGTRDAAVDALSRGDHALALVDMGLPGGSALRTVKSLRQVSKDLPIVVMGPREQTAEVKGAIRRGAFDWIAQPVDPANLLVLVWSLIARQGKLVKPVPVNGLREEPGFKKIIGSSDQIRGLFKSIEIVTGSDVPVLIQGETGTGKELVAKAVHYRGPRRKHPLVPVNCAAIPEPLLESELFGHERGAFTGAVERTKGKFEVADGGTLFMDEIGDMAPATQAKILRVIEDGAFRRVGGTDAIRVDVRIISATNKDLAAEVKKGTFREDLYYRLGVFPITLPPLRERRNDIPELAEYFLDRCADETKQPVKKVSDAAMRALVNYDWPGNVRELQNIIRRATLLAEEQVILPKNLGIEESGALDAEHSIEQEMKAICQMLHNGEIVELARIERVLILRAVRATNGNITDAAARLGVSRSTIYRKIAEEQTIA